MIDPAVAYKCATLPAAWALLGKEMGTDSKSNLTPFSHFQAAFFASSSIDSLSRASMNWVPSSISSSAE